MYFKIIPKISDPERFLSKISIDQNTDCWNWTMKLDNDGYGRLSIKGVSFYSHRVSWSIFIGDASSDMVLDHICRNRACCNPDHLREVTMSINSKENNISPYGKNYAKTHCKQGHEYNEENTYYVKNGRACVICRKISNKKCKDKNKEKYNLNKRLKRMEVKK